MPNFPIIDTHVHLSNIDRIRYSNLKVETPSLHRSFGLEDFRSHAQSVALKAYVVMELCCDHSDRGAEVEWVTELAARDPRLQGIVACALIEKGAAVETELEAYTRNPLVKGVRRNLEAEDIEFCLQPAFLEGLRCLPKFDLGFDICVHHQHLSNVVKMAGQCPDVRFILDHIGKPNIRDQLFDPWKADIKDLSAQPNVYCKLSGMVTEADCEKWTSDDLRPYFDHVIECFGLERLIFGGDWFISTLATTYPEWVATVDWAVSGCSDEELRRLYFGNARTFYRLDRKA